MTDIADPQSENAYIVGRDDLHDIEGILSVVGSDAGETIRAVQDNADALFTWNYEKGERPALNRARGAFIAQGEREHESKEPARTERLLANPLAL